MMPQTLHFYNIDHTLVKDPWINPGLWNPDSRRRIEVQVFPSSEFFAAMLEQIPFEAILNEDIASLIRQDVADESVTPVLVSERDHFQFRSSLFDRLKVLGHVELILTSGEDKQWGYLESRIKRNEDDVREVVYYGSRRNRRVVEQLKEMALESHFQAFFVETPELKFMLGTEDELDLFSCGASVKKIRSYCHYELTQESRIKVIQYFEQLLGLSAKGFIYDCSGILIQKPGNQVARAELEQLGYGERITMVLTRYTTSLINDTVRVGLMANREHTRSLFGDMSLRVAHTPSAASVEQNPNKKLNEWTLVEDYIEIDTYIKERTMYRLKGPRTPLHMHNL